LFQGIGVGGGFIELGTLVTFAQRCFSSDQYKYRAGTFVAVNSDQTATPSVLKFQHIF